MADPVYLTINEFPGTGAAAPTVVDFNFAGGYISPAHVKAEIFNPATYLRTPVTVTDDNFVTDYRLSLPVVVPTGSVLRVYRDTPKDQPLVDFTNGARIAENNLDLVAQQAVFVAAESADQITATQVADVLQAVEAAALSATAAQADAAASAASATLSQAAAQDGASIAGGFALTAAGSAAAASSAAASAAAAAAAAAAGVRDDLASPASGKGASLIATTQGRTAQARFDDFPNVADKTSIQAAVDAVTGGALSRGALWFTPGSDHTLSAEVLIHRKTLKLTGQNSAIKWEGPNTQSMIRVTDSARVVLSDMILLGNLDTPPVAAVFFDRTTESGEVGTNENHIVENVTIGRKFTEDTTTGGSSDATPYGKVQNGIIVGGIDGNNDELTLKNVQVHGATVVGIDFRNTQSIWSTLTDVLVNDCDTGLKLGCNIRLDNVNTNRNRVTDLQGIRESYAWISSFNSENSVRYITSTGGASFFVRGGKWRRNSATPVQLVRIENGGHLLLEEMTISNAQDTADTFYFRAGSALDGSFVVRRCNIARGSLRDTWDVETGGLTTKAYAIDIESGSFRWVQSARSPYIDRAVTPASVAAGASALIGSGSAKTPFGTFFNVSYQFDLQGQHLTTAYDSATNIRARLMNPTGGAIALAAGRMRWMAFEDHIDRRAKATIDAPSMSNGTGYTATIPLLGAKRGDYITYATSANYMNSVVTAYVSSDDVVSLRVHNASGGTSDPGATEFTVARVNEFGRFHGQAAYTPSAVANGSTITLTCSVPGAQLGGHTFVAYTEDLKGMICTAHVSAADTVTVVLSNYTGASVTLAAGYFKAMVAF